MPETRRIAGYRLHASGWQHPVNPVLTADIVCRPAFNWLPDSGLYRDLAEQAEHAFFLDVVLVETVVPDQQ